MNDSELLRRAMTGKVDGDGVLQVELLCSRIRKLEGDIITLEGNIRKIEFNHQRFATGRLVTVDFKPENCEEGEMMLEIATPAGGVCAGDVEWRMKSN